MKKIDILNFITNNRKSPNDIKTFKEILAHLGAEEVKLNEMISELKQTSVLKEVEVNGEKSFQVVTK